MNWNVSQEIVNELLSAQVPGVHTRLQAVAVLQHCSVNDISLFDFFGKYRVDGMMLLPKPTVLESPNDSPPADAVAASEAEPSSVAWKYECWRDAVAAVDRLELLRKHIAEVRAVDAVVPDRDVRVQELEEMARKLARVVEPVPTLGMVSDDDQVDDSDDSMDEYSADPMDEPHDQSSVDDAAEIAQVLSNPQAAGPVESPTARKDAQGRTLVTAEMLEEIFVAGSRIGITRDVLKEMACEKFKLRVIDDLPETVAKKFLQNMVSRAAEV